MLKNICRHIYNNKFVADKIEISYSIFKLKSSRNPILQFLFIVNPGNMNKPVNRKNIRETIYSVD